ncbi:MAG TPA: hypothetical protein P5572_18315, partial [Phycisphaerae bacterium]|nr:hypothetical protein [Phycisphaerae bacterium]
RHSSFCIPPRLYGKPKFELGSTHRIRTRKKNPPQTRLPAPLQPLALAKTPPAPRKAQKTRINIAKAAPQNGFAALRNVNQNTLLTEGKP